MKRFLASALIMGVATVGLVGCEQKTEDKVTEVKKTPGGEEKTTSTIEVKKSGDAKDPAPEAPK